MPQIDYLENTQNYYDKMALDTLSSDYKKAIDWYILDQYAKSIEFEFLSEFISHNLERSIRKHWEEIDPKYLKYVEFDEEKNELRLIQYPKNVRWVFNDIIVEKPLDKQ